MTKKETTQSRANVYFDGCLYSEFPSIEYAFGNLQNLISPYDPIDRSYLFPITIVEK